MANLGWAQDKGMQCIPGRWTDTSNGQTAPQGVIIKRTERGKKGPWACLAIPVQHPATQPQRHLNNNWKTRPRKRQRTIWVTWFFLTPPPMPSSPHSPPPSPPPPPLPTWRKSQRNYHLGKEVLEKLAWVPPPGICCSVDLMIRGLEGSFLLGRHGLEIKNNTEMSLYLGTLGGRKVSDVLAELGNRSIPKTVSALPAAQTSTFICLEPS